MSEEKQPRVVCGAAIALVLLATMPVALHAHAPPPPPSGAGLALFEADRGNRAAVCSRAHVGNVTQLADDVACLAPRGMLRMMRPRVRAVLAVASTPSEGVREDVALVTADGPFALVATLTQLVLDVDASGTHIRMRRVRMVRDMLCVESVEEHGDGRDATYVPRTRTRNLTAFGPSVVLTHDFDADTAASRPGLARADEDAASACPARGYAFFVTPRVTRHPVIARRLRLQGEPAR